jgi:hypothetical protein
MEEAQQRFHMARLLEKEFFMPISPFWLKDQIKFTGLKTIEVSLETRETGKSALLEAYAAPTYLRFYALPLRRG